MQTDALLRWRSEFPILERSTYLVSHSLGAMPRAVPERLAAFAEAWANRGVLVCADLYQAAGTVPVDVAALGVDFAMGGSVKWLCGGPGAGYLHVAPHVPASIAPRLTGWAGHAAPFAFETTHRYAPGAA